MFNGIDHIHFRDVLEGDYYYITLLHYRTKNRRVNYNIKIIK